MATAYFIACHDCKIVRSIGKHMEWVDDKIADKEDARLYSYKVEDRPFQAGLALGFYIEHNGHKCEIFSDCSDNGYSEYMDDYDYFE